MSGDVWILNSSMAASPGLDLRKGDLSIRPCVEHPESYQGGQTTLPEAATADGWSSVWIAGILTRLS